MSVPPHSIALAPDQGQTWEELVMLAKVDARLHGCTCNPLVRARCVAIELGTHSATLHVDVAHDDACPLG